MKLGLQGISVIFSSGDNGVAGHPRDDSDNGCLGDNGTIFSPSWPNNCPYVTSVGATQIDPGSTVYDPESAAYDANYNFTSGGGFSNIYTQPTYQQEAVAAYLKQYPPSSPSYDGIANFGQDGGVYNRLGRG
jgi:tripeptidyl-peptidase-1